jgi:hypothetical protein
MSHFYPRILFSTILSLLLSSVCLASASTGMFTFCQSNHAYTYGMFTRQALSECFPATDDSQFCATDWYVALRIEHSDWDFDHDPKTALMPL